MRDIDDSFMERLCFVECDCEIGFGHVRFEVIKCYENRIVTVADKYVEQ